MSEKKYVLVYGSLRVGEYNFKRFQAQYGSKIEIIDQQKELPGFKMYDLGIGYPGIKKGNYEETIVVDVLEVAEEVANQIDMMEKGAGYLPTIVKFEDKDCTTYIYTGSVEEETRVIDGNWSKHLNNRS